MRYELKTDHDTVVVSNESRTVLLVTAAPSLDKFHGAFLSPEHAREIANKLLEAADLAENDHRRDLAVGATYSVRGGGSATLLSEDENGFVGTLVRGPVITPGQRWDRDGVHSEQGIDLALLIREETPAVFG